MFAIAVWTGALGRTGAAVTLQTRGPVPAPPAADDDAACYCRSMVSVSNGGYLRGEHQLAVCSNGDLRCISVLVMLGQCISRYSSSASGKGP